MSEQFRREATHDGSGAGLIAAGTLKVPVRAVAPLEDAELAYNGKLKPQTGYGRFRVHKEIAKFCFQHHFGTAAIVRNEGPHLHRAEGDSAHCWSCLEVLCEDNRHRSCGLKSGATRANQVLRPTATQNCWRSDSCPSL